MAKRIRVVCPVCGMLTDEEQMQKNKEKPAKVRLFLQEFGGKVKVPFDPMTYKPFRKGGNPGSIKYTDVTSEHHGEVAIFTEWFENRAKEFLSKTG